MNPVLLVGAVMNRRALLAQAGFWAAGPMLSGSRSLLAFPRDSGLDTEKSAAEMLTPKTVQAIKKGLEYIAGRQQDDGAFGSGGYGRNVAVCGLAGMAFLAAGSTP